MKTLTAAALLMTVLSVVGCRSQDQQQDQRQVQAVIALDDAVAIPADDAFKPGEQMAKRTRAAAVAVLASLDDAQRTKATRPIKDPLRKDWHFVPRDREGLPLGEMSVAQKTRVHALMQTALSDSGYLKATDIIWLETVLAEMENRPEYRDAGKYALIIFGDPADEKAAWGWRLEGHHLSINLTYSPGDFGVTPLFYGTNPAVVQQGPLAGKRVLGESYNIAIELVGSMSEEEIAAMRLKGKPRDIVSGPGRELQSLTEPSGIKLGALSPKSSDLLIKLFNSFASDLRYDHNEQVYQYLWGPQPVAVLRDEAVYFAWAGPTDGESPFYFRIQSDRFVIEYSCQGKNHVHCVIHDLSDPLQEDLLKKHFEQHAHE